jgi:hypothetical protein
MQLRHALVIKGDLATDEDIQNDTKAPDINLWTGVSLCLQELRSGKVEGATEGLEKAFGGEGVAQAKIDDLDVARLADKNVLNLQITMNKTVTMAIVQGTRDLAAKLPRLLLL